MIRITRLTDYGIVLLQQIVHAPAEEVSSARDLAEKTGLPLPTVSKICKALTREGILASHRGTQGGYRLARPASEISVADVIEALEGPIALTDCAGDHEGACEIALACPLAGNWQRITDAVRSALVGIPLDEMARPYVGPRLRPAASAEPPSAESPGTTATSEGGGA